MQQSGLQWVIGATILAISGVHLAGWQPLRRARMWLPPPAPARPSPSSAPESAKPSIQAEELEAAAQAQRDPDAEPDVGPERRRRSDQVSKTIAKLQGELSAAKAEAASLGAWKEQAITNNNTIAKLKEELSTAKEQEVARKAEISTCKHGEASESNPIGEQGRGERERTESAVLHAIVGLTATATLLPATFALTQIDKTKPHVWALLDQFLAIFLAVVWFQGFLELTDLLHDAQGMAAVLFGFLRCFVVYLSTIVLAWFLRRREHTFQAFCTCCAHFVSFAGLSALGHAQRHLLSSFQTHPFVSCVLAAFALALLLWIKNCIARKILHEGNEEVDKEWHEATDDIGWDFAGMVLAFLITQALHYVLLGELDNLSEPEASHSREDVSFFLCYLLGLIVVGSILIPWLDHEAHSTHAFIYNASHVARNVIAMMTAWAFLLCTKWALIEHGPLAGCTEVFSSMVFAICVSAFTIVVLAAMILRTHQPRGKRGKSMRHLILQSLGLVCAWSWEQSFDKVEEAAAELFGARTVKSVSSFFFFVVLAPLYVSFVKPKAAPLEKALEEEGEKESEGPSPKNNNSTAGPPSRNKSTNGSKRRSKP